LAALTILNGALSFLILGTISLPESVARFAAAVQGSQLVSVPLNIAVLSTASLIAAAHAQTNRDDVLRIARGVARFALLGSLPIAATLTVFGSQFLSIYGSEFQTAYPALVVLVLGEVVNVAAGP